MDYVKEIEQILQELETTTSGLTQKEAMRRLQENGKNKLPAQKRKSVFQIFFSELTSPIELILVLTILISFGIGEIIDALVISFIVLVDVLMGTYQENKALKSAEALSKMLKVKAKVLREQMELEIDAEDIVVGDILLVDSGTKITSDARIFECQNLQVNESVLTGESVSVEKMPQILEEDTILAERKNMLYAGTSVMTGRAKAVVVATAENTEIGKIASSVASFKETKSPLTIRMEKFSKQISVLIAIVAFVSALLLWSKGYEMDAIFLSVVALAVSAMPEGLSLAFTMALTIASNRMGKKNVIVKKLNAVESLGSCTFIATDKTGTLTINEQTAKKIVLANASVISISSTGYQVEEKGISDTDYEKQVSRLVGLCGLNNEASFNAKENVYYGDSIDIAFLVLQKKLNCFLDVSLENQVPYESEKGYSAIFYREEGKLRCTIKGSLEKVLQFSKKEKRYQEQNEWLSKEGYRVIAVADGLVEEASIDAIQNLDFLGLVAFIDPIREDVKNSIAECQKAGIQVVMITGDHPFTAYSIAQELSLATSMDEVTTGRDIEEAYQKGKPYFDSFIRQKRVFSRVTPTDKLHIIESYKRNQEFVAVTGDGVNDAPAIKAASIGIAMGSGTDVAKDTASMIILDDRFTSIVSGVKEGRVAYSNIRKITLFLLSCGMAEVLFYLLSVLFGYELPLIAIQLLWLNVVTDGLQDVALSFEGASPDIMKEKPRSTGENLFNKELMIEVGIFGFTIAMIVFFTWKYLMDRQTDLVVARSIIMMLMVLIQNIHVLNCRSEKNSVFSVKLWNNPFVIATIILSIGLQILITEIPPLAQLLGVTALPFQTIIILLLLAFIVIIVAELYKFIYRNFLNRRNI